LWYLTSISLLLIKSYYPNHPATAGQVSKASISAAISSLDLDTNCFCLSVKSSFCWVLSPSSCFLLVLSSCCFDFCCCCFYNFSL
jgi:hypothetical protein